MLSFCGPSHPSGFIFFITMSRQELLKVGTYVKGAWSSVKQQKGFK
jgi:hypothetical protein